MRKIILIIGGVLLLINSLSGLIISIYPLFNWLLVDVVLLFNTILIYWISNSTIKDGFKISLLYLLPIAGFITLLLALYSPYKFINNYCFLGILIIAGIEAMLVFICKSIKS